MIKPYYKHEHTARVVEVEDYGVIDLNDLPIQVRQDEAGHYLIGWVREDVGGKTRYQLSETGGRSLFDFGGRALGVIEEIG